MSINLASVDWRKIYLWSSIYLLLFLFDGVYVFYFSQLITYLHNEIIIIHKVFIEKKISVHFEGFYSLDIIVLIHQIELLDTIFKKKKIQICMISSGIHSAIVSWRGNNEIRPPSTMHMQPMSLSKTFLQNHLRSRNCLEDKTEKLLINVQL